MNEAPKNRRLQIMPEVLPAPTVTKPGTSSSVRNQTLSHMQRLLATAAAIPLASCTRTDSSQGTQTVTIPVASASATAQDTTQGSLLPPPSATATATAQPTATHDMGYAVVDPMPAPARCMGLAAASKASAAFKKEAGGLVLEFALTLPPNGPQWSGSKFQVGQKPSPWAGSLVSSHVMGSTMIVKVNVSPGSTSSGVSIPIDCSAGSGSIGINASFSSVSESAKVTLTTHDY